MKCILSLFIVLSFMTASAQNSDPTQPAESAATKANDTEDKVLTETTTQPAANSNTVELGDVTGTQKYKYTCTSGADVREITVITQADNSVGVVYKKSESTKTIALAKNDPSYADLKAEKVKGNLETAGYTCTKE